MGMASASTNKKKKKKNGNAKKPPFDAAASLLKMEKKYEKLCSDYAKLMAKKDDDLEDHDVLVREYMIAARSSRAKGVSDWIPVAQLAVARPFEEWSNEYNDDTAWTAPIVSCYCREISQAAIYAANQFRTVPRQELEYSMEPMESFEKHVYDNFNAKKQDTMSKVEARQILELPTDTTDAKEIKASYRKKSFEFHPDRFVGTEQTTEEAQASNDALAEIQLAYETLSSGNGDSWYASLGGKERTDFVGPVEIMAMSEAKAFLESKFSNLDCAIAGLDPELVQTFVVRNQNV